MNKAKPCPICALPINEQTAYEGLGSHRIVALAKKLGHNQITLGYANKHRRECAVIYVTTNQKHITDSDGLDVSTFAEDYASRADYIVNPAYEENITHAGVPVGAKWAGGTMTEKVRIPVIDERTGEQAVDAAGDPVFANVNRWNRYIPEKPVEEDSLPEADLTAWREKLTQFMPSQKRWEPPSRTEPVSYVVAPSDLQAGKPGTDEAIQNFLGGVQRHKDEIDHLLDRGYNITDVYNLNGGDICEGVANNYRNQSRITLKLTEQLDIGIDTRYAGLLSLTQPGAYNLHDWTVPSNHGESWVREGGKEAVTDYTDNIDIHVARQVERLAKLTPALTDTVFNIQDSGWAIIGKIADIKTYLSHGHSEKGSGPGHERNKNAMQKQILGNLKELWDLQLIFMAHYHHSYMIEFERKTLHGLPATEGTGTSEYMRRHFGVWSDAGVSGMLVGESMGVRAWGHLNVF